MLTGHQKRTLLETPCLTTAIAIGGAILTTFGVTLGLATNNPALMSISLCIGAGGAIGWLMAGGVSRGES